MVSNTAGTLADQIFSIQTIWLSDLGVPTSVLLPSTRENFSGTEAPIHRVGRKSALPQLAAAGLQVMSSTKYYMYHQSIIPHTKCNLVNNNSTILLNQKQIAS